MTRLLCSPPHNLSHIHTKSYAKQTLIIWNIFFFLILSAFAHISNRFMRLISTLLIWIPTLKWVLYELWCNIMVLWYAVIDAIRAVNWQMSTWVNNLQGRTNYTHAVQVSIKNNHLDWNNKNRNKITFSVRARRYLLRRQSTRTLRAPRPVRLWFAERQHESDRHALTFKTPWNWLLETQMKFVRFSGP